MTALAKGDPCPSSGGTGDSLPGDLMTHLPILLKPDPTRVVIRPFIPSEDDAEFATAQCTRAQRIADRVLALGEAEAEEELHGIQFASDEYRDIVCEEIEALGGYDIDEEDAA